MPRNLTNSEEAYARKQMKRIFIGLAAIVLIWAVVTVVPFRWSVGGIIGVVGTWGVLLVIHLMDEGPPQSARHHRSIRAEGTGKLGLLVGGSMSLLFLGAAAIDLLGIGGSFVGMALFVVAFILLIPVAVVFTIAAFG